MVILYFLVVVSQFKRSLSFNITRHSFTCLKDMKELYINLVRPTSLFSLSTVFQDRSEDIYSTAIIDSTVYHIVQ